MNFAFDLISDLHACSDPQTFDWTGQPTALYCVVAGDIARDRDTVINTVRHLSQRYSGVFVIDGNDEHRNFYDCLPESYDDLSTELGKIPGVIYLQNNVVIINGVAIVATNGWWTYNFNPFIDFDLSMDWFIDYVGGSRIDALDIMDRAYHDAAYLVNSVKSLTRHPDVKSIVIVTHTLPSAELVRHDINLFDTFRVNCLGNNHLRSALREDTEKKITTWCFGHYHMPVDRDINGIRYVSNPRGRFGTDWYREVYYPLRIEI